MSIVDKYIISTDGKTRHDYADICGKVDFITDIAKRKDVIDYKIKAWEMCDRHGTISILDKYINDIYISTLIEAGMYEHVLTYIVNYSAIDFIKAIYTDKLNNILSVINKESELYNKNLVNRIMTKKIDAQMVALMEPQNLVPENWEDLIKKRELQKFKRENMATTNLYKCYKCGERKCSVIQLQIRSADEPMTNRITCLVCKNKWDR